MTSGKKRDSHPLDERGHLHEIHGGVVSRRFDRGNHQECGILIVDIRMGYGPSTLAHSEMQERAHGVFLG